ncbi:MAG: DUF58 domain-containing protein [Candidatus Pacebacteria bacterium]|nr:DUF58 domain-containing protein [Candidatus Paceibacterota bacterium]
MLTRELISNVRRIEIRTRRIVDDITAGAYHSVFKGRGIEFEEVREYIPGDDVRSIDWNVSARFGRPFIKKFVEERELTVLLLVDISASGDFGSQGRSKNEMAAEIAALLAFSAIRNNDQVGLLTFTTQRELFIPPRKGRRHVLRLVRELLANERREEGTDIGGILETAMHLLPRRAVVFLISDMLDSAFEQQLRIMNNRHDVVAMRVTDPRELALPALGLVALQDAETGATVIFNSYRKDARRSMAVDAGGRRLRQESICRRAAVDLIDFTCGQDTVRPLVEFFRKRERRLTRE